ncbi:hypothetical protein H9L13_06110 [Sphingomonas lutea]|uniref:Uncharacterized protein n=1 Tax=Sphingomonas lutea TaxID=1045317 RepID=A0A7G9SKQ3_9SPHN|nr:hypothetical protein [Sphingomonas lutea]QNN68428.1 hypothetical protein H9L13_06110 [Sphingomonas lutea]
MIAILGASALALVGLQAGIAAPTDAFRGCLREASAKASNEKIGADAIEGYLRTNCSVQMDALKAAVVAFRVKNGMAKKAAAEDATMTVDDYVATPVEKYKFMAEQLTAKPQGVAMTPAAQPAAAEPKKQ